MNASFLLSATQPFRLDFTVWALRRRNKNIIDLWNNVLYERLFIIEDQCIKLSIEQNSTKNILVSTNIEINDSIKNKLSFLLQKMLGLMCNAISCQLLSLHAGLQIQNRLIQHTGRRITINEKTFFAFPLPQDVARCSVAELKKIGYSSRKSATIIDISSFISTNKDELDNLENSSNADIIKYLCQFKSVGRWSAEYVLLRGLGKIEIFPGDDVGAKNNLQQLLHYNKKLDYDEISNIVQK